MNSIQLNAREAAHLHATGMVQVRRPVKFGKAIINSDTQYLQFTPEWLQEMVNNLSDPMFHDLAQHWIQMQCPIAAPGERRWVAEPWRHSDQDSKLGVCVLYEADKTVRWVRDGELAPPADSYRPDIVKDAESMPAWASRATVVIESVSVQRVQEASVDDIKAMGHYVAFGDWRTIEDCQRAHKTVYAAEWDAEHGAGAWEHNGWVWCVTVRKEEGDET